MDLFKFGLSIPGGSFNEKSKVADKNPPWKADDFEQVLSLADELDLEYVDLRNMGDKDIIDITDSEVQTIKELIDKYKAKVSSISPYLFFRLPLTKRDDELTLRGSFTEHLNMLHRAIELTKIFNTNLIRTSHFESEYLFTPCGYKDLPFDIWGKIIERLEKAAMIAEEAGVILGLENCHWGNLGTGFLVSKALNEIKSKNLRLWWDPANSAMASGENPYPDEYEYVKDYIVCIDIKDTIIDKRYSSLTHVPMGDGNRINWPDIFKALSKNNYQGLILLEACYKPEGGSVLDGARESFSNVRQILASFNNEE